MVIASSLALLAMTRADVFEWVLTFVIESNNIENDEMYPTVRIMK